MVGLPLNILWVPSSITAWFGNLVFTSLQHEMVSLLISVFWAVLVVFVNVSFLPYYRFLVICFTRVLTPCLLLFFQTFANFLSHLHCYVELQALEESMRHMSPRHRLTYFEARLNVRHATAEIWEATAEHRQHACPWYIGDNRQRNRPLNAPQYWVACDLNAIVFLPKSRLLNAYQMPVSPTHQRVICYIPDAPERGRYSRLSNFLPLLRLCWRAPGHWTSACLHYCSIR